jgi:23S rRNA pseudouridine2605 synthase
LARLGHGSRRALEARIAAGEIRVNGKVVGLGTKVIPGDRISLGRQVVIVPEPSFRRASVLLYNKPEGEVCTRDDPEGRPTVFERLPKLDQGRWVAVGRLDANTQGVLLFTDDGELANDLMHPSGELVREYAARVLGEVDAAALRQLTEGIELDDGMASFDEVRLSGGRGANVWYHCFLREGRKREVRRLWEALGCRVSRLIRVAYGPIRLPEDLPRGRWRELEPAEIGTLRGAIKRA